MAGDGRFGLSKRCARMTQISLNGLFAQSQAAVLRGALLSNAPTHRLRLE